MQSDQAVTALAALAQETRLAIYRLLVEAGPQGFAAGSIGERLAVPAATLSFHLKALAQAGLIESQQDGRYVIYAARFDRMLALVDYLTLNCCGSDADACRPKTK